MHLWLKVGRWLFEWKVTVDPDPEDPVTLVSFPAEKPADWSN